MDRVASKADAQAPAVRWSAEQGVGPSTRVLAQEVPVALVHDGSTTAVMMSSPADLEDLAVGFSLTEGIVETASEIRSLEVVASDNGIEVRMWLTGDRTRRLAARRRHLAGPTGCGLCGIESLAEAVRPAPPLRTDQFIIAAADLLTAIDAMTAAQALGRVTRAVHAAALWRSDGFLLVREDVGRHNALDKLVGAVASGGHSVSGVLLLTSRVSVEMVQKAAVLGAPVICAVSAPTALAVETAKRCGLSLVAVARADGFEVFAHPERIALGGR